MSLDEEQFDEENEIVSSNKGWSSGSSIEDCPLGPLVWASDTIIVSRGWSKWNKTQINKKMESKHSLAYHWRNLQTCEYFFMEVYSSVPDI